MGSKSAVDAAAPEPSVGAMAATVKVLGFLEDPKTAPELEQLDCVGFCFGEDDVGGGEELLQEVANEGGARRSPRRRRTS